MIPLQYVYRNGPFSFKVMEFSSPNPSVHEHHQSLIFQRQINALPHLFVAKKNTNRKAHFLRYLSLKKHKTNTVRSFRNKTKHFWKLTTAQQYNDVFLHRSFSASFSFQIRGTVSQNGILVRGDEQCVFQFTIIRYSYREKEMDSVTQFGCQGSNVPASFFSSLPIYLCLAVVGLQPACR